MANLSIVVVNYNTAALLRECLTSIAKTLDMNTTEIIVVDNASVDDSVTVARHEFPSVRLMVQAENLGFCAANNLGVAASSAPYVMLLNSDAVLLGDAGRILIRYLEEHRGVNCVGPRIVLPNGEPQHRLWPVALVARKPVVCLVQWFFFEDWERRYKLPLEKIMRAVSQRAGYRNFIVQTQTMRRYFEALMPSARIWTLGCGVGDDLFQPPGQDGDYVLFLGRLDVRQKGLDLMIDALEQIHKAGAVLPLKVVGEGPGREYLEREVTARGLGDCVTLLGRLEGARKRDVLQGCAFVVMPSRQETFGIGALEAMAASKPVVGFDIDHLNEILRPAWAVLAGAPMRVG